MLAAGNGSQRVAPNRLGPLSHAPGRTTRAGTCLPGKRTSAELNPCVTLAVPARPRMGSALAAWAGRADGQNGRWAGWR
jgi:hypothetical protein